MVATGLPLALDHTLPFVKAVMDAAGHPSALDTAADIFRQIERTHGIEILRDFCADSILPISVGSAS